MWHYVLWHYDQMNSILVPSLSTGKELEDKGINPAKIRLFPRGIDIERFHPSKQNHILDERHSLRGHTKLLYVGRVSREKNLQLLTRVFRSLIAIADNVSLIVVGEGPYLQEMQQDLKGTPVLFTGYLRGEELAQTYASCDLFVFPSTTDTFGNVVLEAQASGLPVIVTDCGGPQENLIPGVTGIVVPSDDADALLSAVLRLIRAPAILQNMAKEARRYMEDRSFEKAFEKTWQIYGGRAPEHPHLAAAV
jgi:glycosyltransferase involved in cell wall biosynthesis